MRKITELASKAFWDGEIFKLDNTIVQDKMMLLHGNMIAWVEYDKLIISSRGWNTNTTKERLNGILNRLEYKIYQKKGIWHIYNSQNEESIEFYDNIQLRLGA